MDIFPFLSFPSVVTDITLGKLTPYELFSFSLHSEEARNIVKTFSNSRKFHMDINLNDDELTFNYENEEKNNLVLIAYPYHKPTDLILKFDGLSEIVFAEIETNEDRTKVSIYSKKKERGQRLQFLMEYMAKIFKNTSISIVFGDMCCGRVSRIRNWTDELREEMKKEHSELVKIIKATIKECNFNICSYHDYTNIHTFKELEPLIKSESLDVLKCRLTKKELKTLFDKWMTLENPGEIRIGDFKNFQIKDLSSGNSIESKETTLGPRRYFDVTRADGSKARIDFWCGRFSFEII